MNLNITGHHAGSHPRDPRLRERSVWTRVIRPFRPCHQHPRDSFRGKLKQRPKSPSTKGKDITAVADDGLYAPSTPRGQADRRGRKHWRKVTDHAATNGTRSNMAFASCRSAATRRTGTVPFP